jgi:hypothetical protein
MPLFIPPYVKSGLAKPQGASSRFGLPTSGKIFNQSTTTVQGNFIRYMPLKIEYPITLTNAQFEVVVTPVSNANILLAIYHADRTLQPLGGPVYSSAQIPIANGFTGIQAVPNLSISLPAGMYLVAVTSSVDMDFRTYLCPGETIDSGMGTGSFVKRYQVANAFAAFAAPGIPWDTLVTDTIGSQYVVIWQWTE